MQEEAIESSEVASENGDQNFTEDLENAVIMADDEMLDDSGDLCSMDKQEFDGNNGQNIGEFQNDEPKLQFSSVEEKLFGEASEQSKHSKCN